MRGARIATTLIFFAVGWVYAAWATRIPAIKDELSLSSGEFGLAVLGLEGGAVIGLPLGGWLTARIGSPSALRSGFAVFPPALFATAVAPGLGALALALGVMACATSIVDVAMNAQGVELERRLARPVLSRLHAGHPLGLALGGLVGTAAAAAGIGVEWHFAAIAAAGMAAALLATRFLVREKRLEGRAFARPSGRLLALGALAFCAFLLDGAAFNWSAVHMREVREASAGLAAAAFTVFAFALALGRLPGDALVERLGRARVVQLGGAVAAVGALVAIVAPSAVLSLTGWALLGLGLAPLAPTILGAAPASAGVPPGVAIAAVTTVGYLGSFTGPPLIGALAEASSLSLALGLLVLVGAALVAAGRLTEPRKSPRPGRRPSPRRCSWRGRPG
ncbi:MFS transporter [Solirubrobacter sp. CPCC 204708]|uniref:MFS transporter n=1 Tax=Solirubrobacter deserti TaxID=2282478 RepID=A0ABT4RE88_9ACTN|nr:MFS transporter [Solirubrobacter deserti]MBE2316078.1 MFS transporter [Solirubrobacter deserti]MDA0136828.1 MFS transporter [Solirubrobacter deserti]